MSEAETPPASIHLADLLPVGMLAHTGTVGQAMSLVANRKVGQPGWEAFHYERISESEFEITGGLVVMAGGTKKWPGPHDSVVISEADILQQLQSTNVAVGPRRASHCSKQRDTEHQCKKCRLSQCSARSAG